ncbi:MAG: hypothetical protein LBC85_05385 [Fibromonadaceae bacterium]|jgi:hypothetical protein|nr:hypothetical protein [Fibromonadaceae bacterium]
MVKKIIFLLVFGFGIAAASQLFMFPIETDMDSNVTISLETSLWQLLKDSGFEPKKIEQEYFEDCEDINCAISKAKDSGAQGLFRGRLRKKGEDSVSVRFHIDWLAGDSVSQTAIQGTIPLAWEKAIKPTIIKVETNPENSVVMLNGEAICHSPCDLSARGSDAQISAYWTFGGNLWAAKRTIKLGEDTVKVFLELRRSFAETEIRTNPEKAQVFSSEILNLKNRPLGKTPYVLRGLPGETQVRIFSKGYNDTLVSVNIDAVEKQILFVQLSPVTNPEKILEQNLFAKSQVKRNAGLGLLWGSLGPLATGIMICSFAQDDYQKARNLKEELKTPSFGGPNFNAKVQENRKAVKDGDAKMATGVGLIGLSVLLAGVGISLAF